MKNKFAIIGFTLLLFIAVIAGGGASQNASAESNVYYSETQITKILEDEKTWYDTIGIKKGYNGIYYCEWGNKAFGWNIGKQYNWCATWVSYMLIEKFHIYKNVKDGRWLSRSVAEMKSKAENLGIYHSKYGYSPVIGDIVIQREDNHSHTGIYIGNGKMMAGNTSNSLKIMGVNYGLSGYIHIPYTSLNAEKIVSQKKEIKDKVYDVLTKLNLSPAAAAGIMGNIQQETGFNPKYDTYKGSKGYEGYGIFSLTDERAQKMRNYARNKYNDEYSVEGQLEYAVIFDAPLQFDIYTGRKPHVYPTGALAWWQEKMTFQEYSALTSPQIAAEIFERVFERASIPRMDVRKSTARQFYDYYYTRKHH